MVYDCVHCSPGNGVCLEDPPIGRKLNALAFEGFNFDALCRTVYGATARFCPATIAVEVSLHTHTHAHTHTYTRAHTHICACAHTHTHTQTNNTIMHDLCVY